MFPGIADRMNKEITARAPTSMKVKVRTRSWSRIPEQSWQWCSSSHWRMLQMLWPQHPQFHIKLL